MHTKYVQYKMFTSILLRVLTECILNMSSIKCLQVYCWPQHVQVFITNKNTFFHPDQNEKHVMKRY